TTGASVTLSNTQTLATTSQAQTPVGIGLDVPAGGYYVDTANGTTTENEANGNEFVPAEAIVVETQPTVTASGTAAFIDGGSAVKVDPGAAVPADADG